MLSWDVSGEEKRKRPRISIEAFCSEYVGGRMRHAWVVDLSEEGLRIQRPTAERLSSRDVTLDIELPGVDEIVRVEGRICFDRIEGPMRQSGVRILSASPDHRRLLQDYVAGRAAAA